MAELSPLPLRGQVWWVRFDDDAGRRPAVIVSNNGRNRSLATVLVVPLSTAPRPDIPTIVRMSPADGATGSAQCDHVREVPIARLAGRAFGLTPATIRAIDEGLREALGLG